MKARLIILAIFAIAIGFYPLIYIFLDANFGLLSTKSEELLRSNLWNTFFYLHISFGGLALLIGWSQFIPKWRTKYIQAHRRIGFIYFISVLISGLSSLYIAYYATGGLIAKIGFALLGIIWLCTTAKAFADIKNRNIISHQKFMIYSYASATGAITLRIWLPLLTAVSGSFFIAYPIVAWLSWVPNLIFAHYLVKKL
ncbi:MAG: DUF2306 domain-containing protein [Bacteroidota bacterium]